MYRCFIFLVGLLFSLNFAGQSLYFPPTVGSTWQTITPASLGWCEEEIPALIDFLADSNSKAFIVLRGR